MTFATLGPISFTGLLTPTQISGTTGATYAVQPLINSVPDVQRVGTELREVTLGMQFHRDFCDPDAQYAAIDALRESGEVLPLTTGSGVYFGDFVIKTINRDYGYAHSDGSAWDLRLTVTLLEYPTAAKAVEPIGFAIATLSPRIAPSLTPPFTTPAIQMQSVTGAMSEAAGARQRLAVVTALESAASDPAAAYEKARQVAARLQQHAAQIGGMKAGMSGFVSAANNVAAAIAAGNANLALSALDDLERRIVNEVQPAFITELKAATNRIP